MSEAHSDTDEHPAQKIRDYQRHTGSSKGEDWPERRISGDRRSGKDRRQRQDRIDFNDRRKGLKRRVKERRKRTIRISIFTKLAVLSTMLILLAISTTSFFILERQKKQFIGQLVNLGESLVRILGNNARDKLLGEEDLALFQLVNDVAQNEQVLYALIVDHKNVIRAHSKIEEVNKPFSPPRVREPFRHAKDGRAGIISYEGKDALFFERPIVYQKIKVGKVYLAITQEKVLQNIKDARTFTWLLTAVITMLGIPLSLILSTYFSGPIRKLGEGAKALGTGQLNYRVRIKRNDELGDLALAFNRMAEDLELKEKIKDSFGRYVAPEIVEKILANPDDKWMKGLKVEVTVLFVDIRGFTALAEKKDPEGIVDVLNAYFSQVTEAVIKHGGHINKFVGDEAMAVFGAPVSNTMHAQSAVRCALEIQTRISRLNEEGRFGKEGIKVGIGINTGEMVAGNLGSPRRMEYTVIGDNVNVASRITSIAKEGEILISGSTYDLAVDGGEFRFEEMGRVTVRGRSEGVRIFKVLGSRKEEY